MCREGGVYGLDGRRRARSPSTCCPALALAEGEERAALAARYRRLETALRADITAKKGALTAGIAGETLPGNGGDKAPN
jgi:hypothetical protein